MRKAVRPTAGRADPARGRHCLVTLRLAVRGRRGAVFQEEPVAHFRIIGHRCCRYSVTPGV